MGFKLIHEKAETLPFLATFLKEYGSLNKIIRLKKSDACNRWTILAYDFPMEIVTFDENNSTLEQYISHYIQGEAKNLKFGVIKMKQFLLYQTLVEKDTQFAIYRNPTKFKIGLKVKGYSPHFDLNRLCWLVFKDFMLNHNTFALSYCDELLIKYAILPNPIITQFVIATKSLISSQMLNKTCVKILSICQNKNDNFPIPFLFEEYNRLLAKTF